MSSRGRGRRPVRFGRDGRILPPPAPRVLRSVIKRRAILGFRRARAFAAWRTAFDRRTKRPQFIGDRQVSRPNYRVPGLAFQTYMSLRRRRRRFI